MQRETSEINENPLAMSLSAWSSGIKHEMIFWKNWISVRGGAWAWDFEWRLDPLTQIIPSMQGFLAHVSGTPKILDVGAGPLSIIGKNHMGRAVELTATDPLAKLYDHLLADNSVVAPVRTIFSPAEDLSVFLKESSFDLVHCRNALDHSFDPMRGIIEMLRVAKVGGYVVLYHSENEAESENYSGFHQFNFCLRNGRFIFWNRTTQCDVESAIPIHVNIHSRSREGVLNTVIRKCEEFKDAGAYSRHRDRLANSIESFFDHYISSAIHTSCALSKTIKSQ